MDRLGVIVERIEDAATLPVVVTQVLDLTQDPRCNAERLSKVVSQDPILAAKLLRTVNSSFFAFLNRTQDIRTAVVRLGIKSVRSIAMGLSIAKLFDSAIDRDGYSRLGVWRHSVAVGIMNELLTEVVRVEGARELSGEALLVGLVHDIGIILEDQYMHKAFQPMPALARSLTSPLHAVERKQFGFDHQDLGTAVLKKWKFPSELADAVAVHHPRRQTKATLLGKITGLSEMLSTAKRVGYSDVSSIPKKAFLQLIQDLRMNQAGLARVRAKFEERIDEALEIFSAGEQEAPDHSQRYKIDDKGGSIPTSRGT